MTTIAWRQHGASGYPEIAADQLNSYHGLPVTKLITMSDGSVIGGAGGSGQQVRAVIAHLESKLKRARAKERGEELEGEEYVCYPMLGPEDTVELLRAFPDGTCQFTRDARLPWEDVTHVGYFAIGSGSDYAMGAMAVGAAPVAAVAVAMKHDHHTGHSHDLHVLGRPQPVLRFESTEHAHG